MRTSSGCGDCGSPKDMSETIKQACAFLVNGHAGVAAMYRMLSRSAKGDDAAAFISEAEKHDRLAKETSTMVLPEAGG